MVAVPVGADHGSRVRTTREPSTLTIGRLIGVPELKPHDLRHGVAMEVLEQHHDLEQVRALLGHTRIDTTQIYATIRPAQPKRGGVLRRTRPRACVSE